MTTIYWLRNDLRLHDNECLHRAMAQSDRLLLIYVIDPRSYENTKLGFSKANELRFTFLAQALKDLKSSCLAMGGNLMIKTGLPEELIPNLVKQFDATQLIYQKEITAEEVNIELAIDNALQATPCKTNAIWGLTLYHKDDAPFAPADTPLTSKAFRMQLTKNAAVRTCFDTPETLPETPDVAHWGEIPSMTALNLDSKKALDSIAFAGGETEGLKRLNYYSFGTELLTTYRWTRNRSLGKDYSSKLSPWMALGCISPRYIYWQIKEYEQKVKKNASTWWLVFELVWRDYFKFLSMRFGNSIFSSGGYRSRDVEWTHDKKLFERWCQGLTGIPFVDAHMRELNETGFMSNRGRVNCASFLTRDYKIDWRWGAAYFESCLLDYDVSSNWLNWNTQATEFYYTNPVHQGFKYDKDGEYVRSRITELENVPAPIIQAPWLLKDEERDDFEVNNYPKPIEVYSKWSRAVSNILKAHSA